jgi:serine/threonine-protein kinase
MSIYQTPKTSKAPERARRALVLAKAESRSSPAAILGWLTLAALAALFLLAHPAKAFAAEAKTMTVTAEGLADPNADTYKRDKGLLIDDLRGDAKRQIVEKAVGSYVETSTLMQNYTLIHDKVLSRSGGLIKRVIKESPPWVGEDGFAHMLMTAEVYVGDVKNALGEMGRQERVSLLKDMGNPRISVRIDIRDAERGADIKPERSAVAENILKDRVKSFGYRVWSEEQSTKLKTELMETSQLAGQTESTISASQVKAADFSIIGEAKFKKVSVKLQASGLNVTKFVLTSWSVKCVDNNTGEEIYYNNKIPQKQSWADEDQAIDEIGRLIGSEFSKDFFEEHLQAPAKTYQLQVLGLPSYDAGQLLKKEFIGLRPVLNVDFRDFDRSGLSLYEVEFVGTRANFNQLLNSTILAPLNAKLGEQAFALDSSHGNTVRVSFRSRLKPDDLMHKLQGLPPSSLTQASPERIRDVVKTEDTLKKVAEVAPDAAKKVEEKGLLKSDKALDAVKNF